MKVKELIEKLQELNQELEVKIDTEGFPLPVGEVTEDENNLVGTTDRIIIINALETWRSNQ